MATDGQLWRIDCEGTGGDGGGVHIVYVLTDDAHVLPDPDAAYELMRGKPGSIYAHESIRPVDKVTETDGVMDGVHDQRKAKVLSYSLFR